MKRSLLFLIGLTFYGAGTALAQADCPAFWKEVQQFKKADSVQPPPRQAIILVGSSSFTRWKDVQDYFPGHAIINRGFGGSQLTDVIRYAYDIVLPYAPKQVLIYCGENDLASPGMKATEVVERFKTLFGMIRQNLPYATIHFISLKPSPSRKQFLAEFRKANKMIATFLKAQKNAGFINVYDAMLDKDGNPSKSLFVEDDLHMNENGYRIWQKILGPYLRK